MIKILLTGPFLNDTAGGITVHVKNLMEIFKSVEDINIEHFAITDAKHDRESWAKKIKRLSNKLLPFVIQSKFCDVVHLNSTFDNRSVIRDLFYGAIVKVIRKKKVIIQFHGGEPSNVFFFKNRVFKPVSRLILGRFDGLLVLSKYQKDQLCRYFSKIDVTLLPNCISVVDQKKKTTINNDGVAFLFMGRISESKGILNIIEAAKLLVNTKLKFKINICGTGPLQEKLVDEISANKLHGKLQYFGFLSGREKEGILLDSDVMLLPTNHNEGFPYALLEAFSYALPVIATRKGAIAEVIEDNVNGFLINPNDEKRLFEKMMFFCNNPEKLIIMGNKGKEKVIQEYNPEILLRRLTSIYS